MTKSAMSGQTMTAVSRMPAKTAVTTNAVVPTVTAVPAETAVASKAAVPANTAVAPTMLCHHGGLEPYSKKENRNQ